MDGRRLSKWVALLLLGVAAACAKPAEEEEVAGGEARVTARPFDRNAILDDKSLRDSDAMTAADVQKVLDKTPWNTKSVLATYTEGGKTAAQIMTEAATKYGINPLEMLVRVQMEQSLVYKKTAPAATIAIAFGCGCPDSPVCSDRYRGFAAQADCAAGTLSRSMDKSITSQGTAGGWKRSSTKKSEDGLDVTPSNAATAALYTYTPWVGEYGGGKKGVGGVGLHFQVWNQLAEHVSYGAWATQTQQQGNGENDPPTDPPTEPPSDPNEDPPTEDAGAPAVDSGHADSGATHTDAGVDAGPAKDGPPGGATKSGTKGAPEDGSDDKAILGEGSSPPQSNAPPVTSKNKTPTKPSELPTASEEELASKKKSTDSGCATIPSSRDASGALVVLAAAVAVLGGRRRRERDQA